MDRSSAAFTAEAFCTIDTFENEPMSGAEHPANVNLDFSFQGRISEEVLCNYLARAMVITECTCDPRRVGEDLRMMLNTGAKYIARAGGTWVPSGAYIRSMDVQERSICEMHRSDGELVFEACIFENVTEAVNEIAIPPWVLAAFDQPPVERNFRYDKMILKKRSYRDRFGTGHSVPDMTRMEARMFFYYLACVHINAGYEGLHLGQVHLVGVRDWGWVHWTEMLDKVRAYALDHARRSFVLINAHTFGVLGADGRLLFDFHSFPVRGRAPDGSVPHAATEDAPQEVLPGVGLEKDKRDLDHMDSIFTHSMGGLTHSDWECDSLPYFIELDNWNGHTPELLDIPSYGEVISWWGFDEISWFANQPRDYRAKWLERTYNWVQAMDPVGHLEMPGRRTAALRQPDGSVRQGMYSASKVDGFGDEDAIRGVWVANRGTMKDRPVRSGRPITRGLPDLDREPR